jgi:hypothetical protein
MQGNVPGSNRRPKMSLTAENLALAPFIQSTREPHRQGFVVDFTETRAQVQWDSVSGDKKTWMQLSAIVEIKPEQARKTVTPYGNGKAHFDNGRETWIGKAP